MEKYFPPNKILKVSDVFTDTDDEINTDESDQATNIDESDEATPLEINFMPFDVVNAPEEIDESSIYDDTSRKELKVMVFSEEDEIDEPCESNKFSSDDEELCPSKKIPEKVVNATEEIDEFSSALHTSEKEMKVFSDDEVQEDSDDEVQEDSYESDQFSIDDECKSTLRRSKRVKNILSLKEKVLDGLTRDIEAPLQIIELGDESGRGVIPLEDIPIKTFVCEYKTTGVYTKNIHSKRELEYGLNNESSSCVEVKINGKQKYFDGTRRFNQFGRFINHSTSPNLQLHPPLFVRGKHRIGFFSLHNIPANTELTWDYADRNPEFPWLSEEKPMITQKEEVDDDVIIVKKKTNFESYRKSYYCPLQGCRSSRPIKKLSNHLKDVHGIMDSHRRQQLLADAKKLGKPDEGRNIDITIKESFRRATASTSTLTRPAISAKKGSTKHYKRFNIDEEPLIGEFMKNLASFDGGKRSLPEVRQIASDVSKFLAYACSTKCTWECYRNIQSIKNYVQRLQDDRIGSDGMTTKLDRLKTGLQYACREGKIHLSSDEFQMICGRLSQWNEATEKDGKLIIHSASHKTALTYGPAILVLKGDDTIYFKHYIQNIRPKISTRSSMECALVTARGQPLHHYRDMINSLCRKLGVPDLPTLTVTRKAGATLAVAQTTQETMENISAHMSHSKSTSERYYRFRHKNEAAVAAFNQITDLSGQGVKQPKRGFAPSTVSILQDFFQEDIKSHVRPPLERCRRFLTEFKIEEKSAKQVQDKIFALRKSL